MFPFLTILIPYMPFDYTDLATYPPRMLWTRLPVVEQLPQRQQQKRPPQRINKPMRNRFMREKRTC